METKNLKIKKNKGKKRIGRGGKKGTYSGKGMKGQKSRAGRKFQPFIRELIKRYHKLRGYNQKTVQRFVVEVKTGQLNAFSNGETVSPDSLLEKKIIKRIGGKVPNIKILLGGEKLNKKLTISMCKVSIGARKEIESVGGKIQ